MIKVSQINASNFKVFKNDTKLKTLTYFKAFKNSSAANKVYFYLYCYQLGKRTNELNEIDLQKTLSGLYLPTFSFDIRSYENYIIVEYTCKFIANSHSLNVDEEMINKIFDEVINYNKFSDSGFEIAKDLYLENLNQVSSRPNSYVMRKFKDCTKTNQVTLEEEIELVKNCTKTNFENFIRNLNTSYQASILTTPKLVEELSATSYEQISLVEHSYIETNDIEINKNLNQASCIFHIKVNELMTKEELQVFCYVLGQDDQSILFQNIRERLNLCYSISCSLLDMNNIIVTVNTSENNISDIEKEVLLLLKIGIDQIDYNSMLEKYIAAYKKQTNNLNLQKKFIYNAIFLDGVVTVEEKINLIKEVEFERLKQITKSTSIIKKVVVK